MGEGLGNMVLAELKDYNMGEGVHGFLGGRIMGEGVGNMVLAERIIIWVKEYMFFLGGRIIIWVNEYMVCGGKDYNMGEWVHGFWREGL